MSIRKLILKTNKTLTEPDKTELAGFLSTFDKQTKELASSDARTAEALIRAEHCETIFELYEQCISAIVNDMVTDIKKIEPTIQKYRKTWCLDRIKIMNGDK